MGAGDSFGAALIAALVEHDALEPGATRPLDYSVLEETVEYAVTASAITCTRRGAVPPPAQRFMPGSERPRRSELV